MGFYRIFKFQILKFCKCSVFLCKLQCMGSFGHCELLDITTVIIANECGRKSHEAQSCRGFELDPLYLQPSSIICFAGVKTKWVLKKLEAGYILLKGLPRGRQLQGLIKTLDFYFPSSLCSQHDNCILIELRRCRSYTKSASLDLLQLTYTGLGAFIYLIFITPDNRLTWVTYQNV